MDFGMGPYDGLDFANFSFAPQGRFYFNEKPVKPHYYIGLPKWSDMVQITGVKEKDCLKEYAKRLNAIELNATHYKIYDEAGIKKWVEAVDGRDFIFCPKMYKGITHFGTLRGKEVMVTNFFDSIRHLGKHLGPVFISLTDKFTPARKKELYLFLKSLPVDEFQMVLELRNEYWYSSDTLHELTEILHALNIGMVILDTPLIRSSVQFNFLQPKAFIRFVCKGDTELDVYRIKQWKSQLVYLSKHGIEDIYFFLHIHDKNKIEDFYTFVQSEFTQAQRLHV